MIPQQGNEPPVLKEDDAMKTHKPTDNYNRTTPTWVRKVRTEGNIVLVDCWDEVTRKCKGEFIEQEKMNELMLSSLMDNQIIFKSFKPWNPDEWFIDFDVVEFKDQVEVYDYSTGSSEAVNEIISAIPWAMNQYRINNSKIMIVIKDELRNREDLGGYAQGSNRILPYNTVAITLKDDYMDTLFHELRHVAQYEKGVLKEGCFWKGIEVDREEVGYWNLPWEVDARKAAAILCDRWKNRHD